MSLVCAQRELIAIRRIVRRQDLAARNAAVTALQTHHILKPAPVLSLAVLDVLLSALGRLNSLSPFDVFVIGSAVYAPERCRDLDLLLTPRAMSGSALPSIAQIEGALLDCALVGRFRTNSLVDAVYRETDHALALERNDLMPADTLRSIRFEDPAASFELEAGLTKACRRVGCLCVEAVRPAEQCSFFHKLPRNKLTGRPHLAKAVPLEKYATRESIASMPPPSIVGA